MNYSLYILLFSTLFTFTACGDKDEDEMQEVITCETSVGELSEANAILSESAWEWVESRSQGRNGEIIITPESEGKTMSLVFSLGQSVEELENGQATGIWEYRLLESSDTTQGQFTTTWLNAGNIERDYFLDVCPEILILTDASSSLMSVTTYKRK
ncbi:hypothetical protein [Bernardetia sp.]|uniref:hypothetical protein n=1 Tax=Bernardetia sp. TaxID=1937974 RepID=UPI0025BD742D|nr:hypothetical protein [Bernardetia sp.]